MAGPTYHAWTHRPKYQGGTDPLDWGFKIYQIEVFEVFIPISVGDRAFEWAIPEDLDGSELIKVEGYINDPGSGSTEIQLRNRTTINDLLTTKITIDSGDTLSKDSATQPVVNAATAEVSWGDLISVDVDAIAAGGMGMGVICYFAPPELAGLRIEGLAGPAGGVDQWTGAYDAGDTYVTNQSVSYGGTSYVAITNVTTGIIPGVTPGWEDYWQVLVEANATSALQMAITSNAYALDIGEKGYLEVPFDCTIDEAILLADQATTTVVDIWKSDYGTFPPLSGDSICGAAPLSITASNKTLDTSLSGWTTSLVAGDVLAVVVESNTFAMRLLMSLKVLR